MSEIKGLSLWRPWPWAFMLDDRYHIEPKRVENRTWAASSHVGKYIALHAAKKWDTNSAQFLLDMLGINIPGDPNYCPDFKLNEIPHPYSVIFAVCKLENIVGPSQLQGDQSAWASGPYCWVMSDFTPIKHVKCMGAQGLWDLPQDVLEQVRDNFQAAKGKPKPAPQKQSEKKSDMPFVTLATDGSNRGHPGPAGCGFVLQFKKSNGEIIEREGKHQIESGTNNIAELSGVIKGLQALEQPCNVELISDSEYVVKGINSWLEYWVKNGWVNRQKKEVANRDLWEKVYDLCLLHNVRARWVKGHSGHELNERADKLAGEASLAEKERQAALNSSDS